MDMKNTTILLIFLLCILGLIVGVHYTETGDAAVKTFNDKEVTIKDSNNTTATNPEIENNEYGLDKFFT